MEGERCSRVCVPPSFSSLSQILTASRGERARVRSSIANLFSTVFARQWNLVESSMKATPHGHSSTVEAPGEASAPSGDLEGRELSTWFGNERRQSQAERPSRRLVIVRSPGSERDWTYAGPHQRREASYIDCHWCVTAIRSLILRDDAASKEVGPVT